MAQTKGKFLKELKVLGIVPEIISAFKEIERDRFLDSYFKDKFYEPESIPLAYGQEADDPRTLALMLNYLEPDKSKRILEIGTGSGYSTALLASLFGEVVTVDYYETLVVEAKKKIISEGFYNIKFLAGDAGEILETQGEFDSVLITAGCNKRPFSFFISLKDGGRSVFPMGTPVQQQITILDLVPTEDDKVVEKLAFKEFCKYKSIRGEYGWVDLDDSYISEEANF